MTLLQDVGYVVTSGYDADAEMTWDDAMEWAENLTYYDSVQGVTYDDWRLPYKSFMDVTEGLMGHIYSTGLGNKTCNEPGGGLVNTGPFINWGGALWSDTTDCIYKSETWCGAWVFTSGGYEYLDLFIDKNGDEAYHGAWAVRFGDVAAASVLESATGLLFLSLIISIAGIKMDRQRHG